VSESWRRHTRYRDPVDLKKLRFLIEELERVGPAPLDLLEVGCGSGNIARPLASLGHRVLATDIDQASLDFAAAEGPPPSLTLARAGLTDLPAGRRFHAIIASEVLEHVDDPAAALRLYRSALQPGGVVLVTIPNGYGPWEVGQALSPRRAAGWLARKTGLYGPLKRRLGVRREEKDAETSTFNFESPHLQHFTLGRFRRLAESAGYDIVRRVHSDGPLTFFSGARRVTALARFDCRVVDRLPHWLASGWYFVLRPRP
jgi:2-polyprenyl-3-methyl-5-hydroxy-6-metoxy-1,4-benzoquinol methylase